jgi:hypothetical protein
MNVFYPLRWTKGIAPAELLQRFSTESGRGHRTAMPRDGQQGRQMANSKQAINVNSVPHSSK